MSRVILPRWRWFLLAITMAILLSTLAPQNSQANSSEEPWQPVAAVYLRTLFEANLGPQINWTLIASEYDSPITDEGYQTHSALDIIEQADQASGTTHAEAIRQAIAGKDRQALYAASTRAIANMIRYHMAQAEATIAQPTSSLASVREAQRYYRAFDENFIELVDPTAVLLLNEAWQEMELSINSTPADPARFAAARTVIEGYLAANYEVEEFTVRPKLAALPERMGDVEVPIWLPPGSNINEQDPLPLLRLNFEARGYDEKDIPAVAYGDMLFDSPQIFGEPARTLGVACSSCHNRSDINNAFFIPGASPHPGAIDVDGGFFNPFFNDQRNDPLDIPSMRGIRFTAPYGRDGRFGSLREFTRNVIVNEFNGDEPTDFMLDALMAYMLEFDWQPNSMLKRDGTLNSSAPQAAQRGEFLFNKPFAAMGGRACSSCHIPSNSFIDGHHHDIGSDPSSPPFALDAFFDTPTLLNTVYSAPYFHDGSLATLAEVVAWFDTTFGLNLTEVEQADLTSYLEAVGAADTPYQLYDETNTAFMLDWAELNTFCSTLSSKLIPQKDAFHALLLIDTVVPEFREIAGDSNDPAVTTMLTQIADKLDAIKVAILTDDWQEAADLYDDYYALVEAYDLSKQ